MHNVRLYRFVINVLALLLLFGVFGATVQDGRAQEGNPLYLPLIPQGVSPGNPASDALPEEEAAPATEVIPSLPGDPAVVAAAAAFTASLQLTPPDGSVEVPYDPAFDLPTTLTLEAWVRRDGGGNCETILARQTGPAYWFGMCNGKVGFSPNTPVDVSFGVTAVPIDTWTHVAVVWAAGGEQTTYINGEREQTVAAAAPPSTNTAPLVIGSFSGSNGGDAFSYPFYGSIAEVRVWNVARSQDDIRRTMHVALDEPRPGLVANWHLTDDFKDSVGGHDGTPQGTAALIGPGAPPIPPVVPIDSAFNTMDLIRELDAAGSAYIPRLNRAMLIGGFTRDIGNNLVCNRIRVVDAATGLNSELASRLPTNLVNAAATYVPTKDTVYVFGGLDFCAVAGGSGTSDRILAINPTTGAVRTLTARLPFAQDRLKAVYHAGLDKVYLLDEFGDPVGRDVFLFDPATETSTLLNITLPGRIGIAAVWSSATGNIYTFGGKNPAQPQAPSTDAIFEIVLQPDGLGGTTRQVTGALLPDPNESSRAVEDPESKLVYLIGGSGTARVVVFDPLARQAWPTLIQMPHKNALAEVIYSARNRHALVMGSGPTTGISIPIWRIPLGDGPALALGRWDFPAGNGGIIRNIDGDEQIVGVATSAGLIRFDAAGNRMTFGVSEIGTNDVADVRYDAAQDQLWAVTPDAAKLILRNGTVNNYFIKHGELGTASGQLIDLRPGYTNADEAPFVASNEGLWYAPSPSGGQYEWQQAFHTQPFNFISALQHRGPGDLWTVYNHEVNRFLYSSGNSILNLGMPCGQLFGRDIAFTPNFDVWIAAGDVTHPTQEGICRIATLFDPTTPLPEGNILQPAIGLYANHLDVDPDARLWATIGSQCIRPQGNETGGLVAYSAVGFPARVRTSEWNWLNAPLGSRLAKNIDCAGPMFWVSSLNALAAVDERVWAGRFPQQPPFTDQELVTFAPRWQQLDESNALDQKVVEGIWTVRGRVFMATADSLHILEPDGQTWDNRTGLHVRAVIGDQRGNIWLGADDGVRLFTPTGFDSLTDAEGEAPAGPISALAEDRDGRIWIGHQDGLTLFDRDRFVTTLTRAVTGLPTDAVTALLVDRQNRLWVGTAQGLARNDGEQWTQFRQADGLPSDDIHDLAELGDGRIAVSTASGLVLITGETLSVETPPVSTANLPLTVDELGRLWAGSAVLTAQGWQGYYSTNSGLRSGIVADNAADGADRIWFSHAPDPGVSVRGALLPPLADEVPIINSISPEQGRVGDIINIFGTGFGANPADIEVTIGGARAEVIDIQPQLPNQGLSDNLRVRLTADNTSGDVAVAIGGRRAVKHGTDKPAFCAIPTITSISPTGGNIGVRIQISGANFDPEATVRLGGGLAEERPAETSKPTLVTALIQSGDSEGNVLVRNACAGDDFLDASAEVFRPIRLTITLVAYNQGYPSSGSRGEPADDYGASDLVQGKPTMVQFFLGTNDEVRPTDVLEVDNINLTYRVDDRDDGFESRPYKGPVPINPGLGEPPEELRKDIVNSVFGTFRLSSPDFHGDDILEVISELTRNHQVIASSRSLIYVYANQRLNVLLIPIMEEGYTQADLETMKNRMISGLDNARYRIMPMGWTNYFWSPTVIEQSDHVEIGSAIDLFSAGLDMNDVRDHFNEFHPDGATVAFGVVDPRLIDDSGTGGKAFWVDMSEFANGILLPVDVACDILTSPARLFGFDGCDIEIPLYIGWARGDTDTNRASQLIQHETGHILGLVGASASNGELGDNYSHSINDELDGGECGDTGATFNWDKSLYSQPGVNEPVVNPITGKQFYPQNDGNPNTARAKSIMSYACSDLNDNVFFEPVDVSSLLFEYSLIGHRGWVEDLVPGLATTSVSADATAIVAAAHQESPAGPRLSVAGIINGTSGTIERVKPLDDQAPLTFGADSGYWLVQLDAAGKELQRDGVAPIQPVESQPGDPSFFTAKVLRQPGLARLELRRDNTVLDSFSAGSAAPQLTLTNPAGGAQSGPALHVAWSATDPDGDPVRVTVEYSANGGATWDALGFAEGSGTMDVPLAQLTGSANALVRVSGTDGLNITRRVSAPISVPVQAPQAIIGQPTPGSTFAEGATVMLSGSADTTVTGTQSSAVLQWSSSRDGFLGTGAELFTTLSVGTHLLTLQASTSPTLTASASVTISILPDYDFDGIQDAEESTSGLNPLNASDSRTDQDGDGLPLIVEHLRGLDPANTDSDGDGRPDGQELADGTDPNVADAPLAPDALDVSPRAITFAADMGRNTPLPSQQLVITSREPVTWMVSANVAWLGANVASGQTIDGVTIFLKSYILQNGTYTGTLTFSSPQLPETFAVPVVATVTNSGAFFDLNDDGRVGIADVQGVAGRMPSDNSQAGFSRRHDVDRDGLIDQQDVKLITPRWDVGPAQSAPANAPLMQLVAPAVASAETFTVEVRLDAVAQLGGFEARLVYPPTLVEIERVELGPLLGSSGRTAAILGPRVDQNAGTVTFGGYTTGSAAGPNRSDVVAYVIFRVRKEGVATFDLQQPLAATSIGAPVLVRDQDAVVQIGSEQVEPRLSLPIIQKNTP